MAELLAPAVATPRYPLTVSRPAARRRVTSGITRPSGTDSSKIIRKQWNNEFYYKYVINERVKVSPETNRVVDGPHASLRGIHSGHPVLTGNVLLMDSGDYRNRFFRISLPNKCIIQKSWVQQS
jgi:hypothetical protein